MSDRVRGRNALTWNTRLTTSARLLFSVCVLLLTGGGFLAHGAGIADYDLASPNDRSFAFDFNKSGKPDHLVFYRPGSGIFYVVAKVNGTYQTVFRSNSGVGNFDLASTSDRLFAFDYSGSGYLDSIVAYRPGSGIVYILQLQNGVFQNVYTSTSGIADYDLASSDDVLMAYDLDSSGLADHLVAYRPGSGSFYVFANKSGVFSDVFHSSTGIGGFDLASSADRIVPVDFASNGTSDHLLVYRPGGGVAFVFRYQPQDSTFIPVLQSFNGIGDYDLASPDDRLTPFDFSGHGYLSTLVATRSGSGTAYVLAPSYLNYNSTYQSASGIGGYDFMSTSDQLFAFDANSTGLLTSLVAYRPGAGVIYVIGNANGTFSPQYMSMQ
jgi:hypothetical protein